MNFVKRAFLSLKHRAVNNVMLVILFTVLATLILCGLSIHSASISSCTAVRRALGGSVQVTNKSVTQGIPIEDAKKIGALKYVKFSNFPCSANTYAVDFKAVGAPAKGAKLDDINAYGTTELKNTSSFLQGKYKLAEGRLLTTDDVNKNNAVITKNLAELNNIKVGGTITLATVKGSNKKEFTVVGIYTSTEKDEADGSLADNGDNQVFVPYTAALDFSGKNILYAAKYEIADPANIDAFKSEVSNMFADKYSLDAQDGDYRRLSGSLVSISSIANILLYISIIASAAILFLIVLLTFKSRNYEIGILLSVGEGKQRIVLQMAVEILVPILIAFSISAALGNLTAHQIGNVMFDAQSKANSEYLADEGDQDDLTMDQECIDINSINGDSSQNMQNDTKATPTVLPDEIALDVKVSANQYLILYLSGILISLLATLVPIVTVMQFSPKKIFSQLE